MTKNLNRFISALLVVFLVLTSVILTIPQKTQAATSMKFSFGSSKVSGFTNVTTASAYSDNVGYGFEDPSGVSMQSSSVCFTKNADKNTFDVKLAKGLYKVSVTLGKTNRTSVYIENMLQIVNMTGDNAYDSILVPVTDGKLNIRAAAGKAGYTFEISRLEIEQVSQSPTLPKTVWFCGDSTVCNYYPLATSAQAGWGQTFSEYAPGWTVRNMAASGQFARGFVQAGQFTPIKTYGKSGDIFIISIGINDTNPKNSNETEYYNYVTQMTKEAKAKGMRVVLVKQQGRATDVTNNPKLTGRWYGGTLDKISREQNVEVLDLFNLFFDYCKKIGQEKTTAIYMPGDTLHPNREGAKVLASLASKEIFKETPAVTDTPQNPENPVAGDIDTNAVYLLKNKFSGLYMEAESYANAANVSQKSFVADSENFLWKFEDAGNGNYYIKNVAENGKYALDIYQKKATNGTNVEIYPFTSGNIAQQYSAVKNADGSYVLKTAVSTQKAAIEVKDASKDELANVQEWEVNGHDCQSWILEPGGNVIKSEPAKKYLPGDINHDGKVNAKDLALVKYSFGKEIDKDTRLDADVNADGVVDEKDVKIIRDFVFSKGRIDAAANHRAFIYADEAAFSDAVKENTNEGFKGKDYVNVANQVGSSLKFDVYVGKSGNYLCTFNIANGSAENRQMRIDVNGGKDYWMQDFLSTNTWTTWQERAIVLPLKEGSNSIKLTSATKSGGPNINYLKLELTDEPIAETYIPPKEEPSTNPTEPQNPTTSGNHTIYIAGDSTVQTYRASYAPQQGWGAFLQDNVPSNYPVVNRAIAGRSSKSFIDNGRLDSILNEIKPGDYLLVQFGINDSAASKPERYAPTCGKIPGTEGSFEYYMQKYIEGAKSKGATPVLVTTTLGLKAYNSNTKTFSGSYTNYCNAMKQCAAYYKIPCVDLNSLMVNHYNKIGYDAAYKYHMISAGNGSSDMTHFTETGAKAVAKLVGQDLIKQGILK